MQMELIISTLHGHLEMKRDKVCVMCPVQYTVGSISEHGAAVTILETNSAVASWKLVHGRGQDSSAALTVQLPHTGLSWAL